jgi:hypothetical protein
VHIPRPLPPQHPEERSQPRALLNDALNSLGFGGRNGPYFIAVAILAAIYWPWSAWMFRSMYVKPVRRAMRDEGWDVCIECGYDLRGLDGDSRSCPECGASRAPRDGGAATGAAGR